VTLLYPYLDTSRSAPSKIFVRTVVFNKDADNQLDILCQSVYSCVRAFSVEFHSRGALRNNTHSIEYANARYCDARSPHLALPYETEIFPL
jgi:hypothetical protein